MKILLVAPQSNDTVLGMIGLYCKRALENLGYEFAVFDFRQSQYFKDPLGSFLKKGLRKALPFSPQRIPFLKSLEAAKMNSALLAAVAEFQPDLLLVLTGDNIFAKTLKEIKRGGVIIANWFTDSLLDPLRRDLINDISSCYDYFFIVESEDILNYIKVGARSVKTIPLGCDPGIHKRIDLSAEEKKQYASDVSFVGTVKLGRQEVLAQLADFDLGIWGYWQKKVPALERCYRSRYVYGDQVAKVYNASKIVIDLPLAYGAGGIVFEESLRLFEISACAAFVLSLKTPYISGLYEIGREMVYYQDTQELKELIRYYLSHAQERELIAKNGQERSYRDHTYARRLKEMLSTVEKNG